MPTTVHVPKRLLAAARDLDTLGRLAARIHVLEDGSEAWGGPRINGRPRVRTQSCPRYGLNVRRLRWVQFHQREVPRGYIVTCLCPRSTPEELERANDCTTPDCSFAAPRGMGKAVAWLRRGGWLAACVRGGLFDRARGPKWRPSSGTAMATAAPAEDVTSHPTVRTLCAVCGESWREDPTPEWTRMKNGYSRYGRDPYAPAHLCAPCCVEVLRVDPARVPSLITGPPVAVYEQDEPLIVVRDLEAAARTDEHEWLAVLTIPRYHELKLPRQRFAVIWQEQELVE